MTHFLTNRKIDLSKFYFDAKEAEKPIRWIERFCTHVKSDEINKPFILADWQKNILRDIFGWKNKLTSKRKYRQVYIEVPKKNGKSTLLAALTAYLLSADGEGGAEIYGVAGDKDQAKIIFNDTKQMIENNKELKKRFEVYAHSIVYTGGKGANFYKALSHEISTKEGYNAHAVIFDEFHTQKTRELYDTLIGSGAARSQPLFIMITTAGFDKNSICWEKHEYTRKVNESIFEDDQFYGIIFAAPEGADIFDPETWRLANPGYPIAPKHEFLEGKVQQVINEPSYYHTFCRYHLNWWIGAYQTWIPDSYFSINFIENFDIEKLNNQKCYAGLDLASTSDTCSLSLIFDLSGITFILLFVWVPESTADERLKKGDQNYLNWSKQGWLTITPGNVTDYDYIFLKITELSKKYQILNIGYDKWNAYQFAIRLTEANIKCTVYDQGIKSMGEPTKQFERLFISGKFHHFNNPVFRWSLSNVAIYQDANQNIKLNKAKSTGKIDPIVATVIALGVKMSNPIATSRYETEELTVISL